MRKTDLAYYAGIFDGEGCIGLYSFSDKRWTKKQQRMTCQITMTNRWILGSLQFAFGGRVYPFKIIGGRKPAWSWQIYGSGAVEFLQSILPYLHLKKPEAEIAINFQICRSSRKRKITDGERAVEEAQVILMKNLKVSSE